MRIVSQFSSVRYENKTSESVNYHNSIVFIFHFEVLTAND
jgi:hypothetical protein